MLTPIGLCPRLQIVMLGRRQTIFSTPYFQFEERFDFILYICVGIRAMIFCGCVPGIMENIVNYHGKYRKLSWKSNVGILFSDFCIWLVAIRGHSYVP